MCACRSPAALKISFAQALGGAEAAPGWCAQPMVGSTARTPAATTNVEFSAAAAWSLSARASGSARDELQPAARAHAPNIHTHQKFSLVTMHLSTMNLGLALQAPH